MKSLKPNLALTALTTGVLMASGSSSAQIEEIIVTAEFVERNIQATPIAITAVTGEMLEARSQSNIYQVAAQAPNVSLKPGGVARSGMMAYIRGIGQSDFAAALEPGVGVYVDDVYYSQLTGSLLDLLDVERVEILRGPQGTLSGRNSIGGAIKMYTKKPGEDGGGSVELGYGSYNQIDVRGSADLTLVPNTLYARISGASRARDGYIDVLDYACTHPNSGVPTNAGGNGCLLDKHGNQEYTTGRAALEWIASDTVNVSIIADYLNDSSGTAAGTLLWGDRTAIESNLANPSISVTDGLGGDPVYYRDHRFVTSGEFRPAGDPINDPYASYATLSDNGEYIYGGGDPAASIPINFKPLNLPSRNTLNSWGASAQIEWALSGNTSLTSITAYREYDSWLTWDSDYSPLAITQLDNYLDHWQWSQELRLTTTLDAIDYTVGGFWFDQDTTYEARVDLPYALIDFIHGPDPTPATTWALFANATWHLTDRFNLSGGLRYSDEVKDYTHHRHNPDGSDIGSFDPSLTPAPVDLVNIRLTGVDGLEAHFEDTRVDWRVAADFIFNDATMLYASAATGYKGGGVNPRPFFPEQLDTFEPETLLSYEFGVKSTLLDNSLRLNAAIFFTEYEDIQLTLNQCEVPAFIDPDGISAPCAKPANVGNADIKGFELEAEWYITDNLSFDGSFSTLDFDYTYLDPLALGGSPIGGLEMITPYTPELSWSAGVQYHFPGTSMGNFNLRVDASYQDDVYSNPTNGPLNLIDSYTVANARLWWESPTADWTVAFEMLNFSDKLYYHTKFDQNGSVGQVTGQPGLPRTYKISARRSF